MGIFYEMVTIVNRAPVELTVRFDGQESVIPVGVSQIPRPAVTFAKNQNPIMGSQSPNNPSITGAKYLIGVVGTKDPQEPLTEEEWARHKNEPLRMDYRELGRQRLGPKEHYEVSGSGSTMAKSSWDEGVRGGGGLEFESERGVA